MGVPDRRLARSAVLEASGASERALAEVRALTRAGVLRWVWLETGFREVPSADVVFLLDAGDGAWARERVRGLRRAGFARGIVVITERSTGVTDASFSNGTDYWVALPSLDLRSFHGRLTALAYRLRDDDEEDDHLVILTPASCQVQIGCVPVELETPQRFRIFEALMAIRPRSMPSADLIRVAFDAHHQDDSSIVRVHVHAVRGLMKQASVSVLGIAGLEKILDTDPGHGYRIDLKAPAAQRALVRARRRSGVYMAPSTLLLVEDDPLVSRSLMRFLARNRFDVTPVPDCETARGQKRRFPHALIDKCLPDGDGIELGRELVQSGRVESVTLMTAHPSTSDFGRVAEVGRLIDKAAGFEAIMEALSANRPTSVRR